MSKDERIVREDGKASQSKGEKVNHSIASIASIAFLALPPVHVTDI